MSQYQQANAYHSHQQVQMDGREIYKRALLNCASRLKDALEDGGKDMSLYQAAVRHNQHLWTLFQVALTDSSNALPPELKITLLRLSGYVDRVSFRIICEFVPQMLQSLIDINRTLAAGLAKKPQETGDAAAVPAAIMPVAGTPAMLMTSA